MNEFDPRGGKISASAFEIFADCPGMETLKASLPPEALVRAESDDESAAIGTRIHRARQTGNTLPLNEDELAIYQEGLKVEQEIISIWCHQLNVQKYHEGPREIRLWYHDDQLNPVTSGQLDVHYISDTPPAHALVIDLKALHASHLTPAQRNWQGRVQVLCLWEDYDGFLDTITFAFCKPSARWNQKDIVRYDHNNIRHAQFLVNQALWAAKQPDAPRRPGKHCNFCPCHAACPEAAAFALLPSVIAERAVAQADAETQVNALAPADLKRLWQMKPLITKILDLVDVRLKKMPDEALATLGLAKTPGRRMDPITDLNGFFEYLQGRQWTRQEILGVLRDDAVSKTKLAEAIAERETLTKTWAAKRIGEEFAAYITPKRADPGLKEVK